MDMQKTDQAKDLLENFNRVDESIQDKLLNGVKCLAFLYDLKNPGDSREKDILPTQMA